MKKKSFVLIFSLALLFCVLLISCNKKTMTLGDVFPDVAALDAADVKSIGIEQGGIALPPGTPPFYVKTSEKREDIGRFLEFVRKTGLERDDYLVDGGSYTTLTFLCNDGRKYEIRINNGTVFREAGGVHEFYKLQDEIPTID